MQILLLTIGSLAKRYGVCTRTIDRWLVDERVEFPAFVRIRARRYWRIADLEDWERRRATPVKAVAYPCVEEGRL
jgi:hypothetical protein